MKFRILIQHVDEAVTRVSNFIKDFGVNVYDVREANIINNKDGEKMGEAYVLCCAANKKDFEYIKNNYYTTKLKYEGVRTLM